MNFKFYEINLGFLMKWISSCVKWIWVVKYWTLRAIVDLLKKNFFYPFRCLFLNFLMVEWAGRGNVSFRSISQVQAMGPNGLRSSHAYLPPKRFYPSSFLNWTTFYVYQSLQIISPQTLSRGWHGFVQIWRYKVIIQF